MKIDESSINHNLVLVCKEHTDGFPAEWDKEELLVSLARIQGAIDLADKLKALLRE